MIGRMLMGASAAGWLLLVVADVSPILPRLCSVDGWDLAGHANAAIIINPLAPIVAVYSGMLAAMIAPLLARPLREISDRSTAQLRPVAMACFALAYAVPWLLAAPLYGLALIGLETGLQAGSLWKLILPAVLVAIWHMVPARQWALNICHRRLTGLAHSRGDVAAFVKDGARQGAACVLSCAPLMLWAMTQSAAHLPAMALVALFLWVERQFPPEPIGWGWINLARTARRLGFFAGHSWRSAQWVKAHG